MIRIADYDYQLPDHLIAQHPSKEREGSKLLLYQKKSDEISHLNFSEIENILKNGDCLILNDTKVIPARIWGKKVQTGSKTEFLWLEEETRGYWLGLLRGRHPLGSEFLFGENNLRAHLEKKNDGGTTTLKINDDIDAVSYLEKYGSIPLPPYIERSAQDICEEDKERYQTTYAKLSGSVAAPTAGLHFSRQLIQRLVNKGVKIIPITLHVGLGTFQPVRETTIKKNKLHSERYEISEKSAIEINEAIRKGVRTIVVGTTTARALESACNGEGIVRSGKGMTDLFIHSPYPFKIVRNLLTNFHLPKSSLLMLVAALIGREKLFSIYDSAIKGKYRFYSYGDAMLILSEE